MVLFFGILATGLLYVAYSIYHDIYVRPVQRSRLPFFLLVVALLIALAFKFANVSMTLRTQRRQ